MTFVNENCKLQIANCKFCIVFVLAAWLASSGAAQAQCKSGSCQQQPGVETAQMIPPGLIPKEIEGTGIMNVTRVKPGIPRLLPYRRAVQNRMGGPQPRFGPTKTVIVKTKIYPGKITAPVPMPAPRRAVEVDISGPRGSVAIRAGGKSC